MRCITNISSLIIMTLSLAACDMEKKSDVKLPVFKSQLVVESYIEPGKKIQLALSQTQDYYAAPDLSRVFVQGAQVVVSYSEYPGRKDTLIYNSEPEFNTKDSTFKFFNYQSKDTVPQLHPGGIVFVNIIDQQGGRTASAQSTWIDPVNIDSIKVQTYSFEKGLDVYFKDNGGQRDYYRFRVRKLATLDSLRFDFFDNDNSFSGKENFYSTGPVFQANDTVEVSLYHITPEYYNYLLTADQASQSNGNPFAIPATITSNVKGGTGIFTVLPFSRRIIVIK